MKKILFTLIIFIALSSMGIKQITSFPSLTTTERNALTSVVTGTVVLNTTTSQLERYNGSTWVAMIGGGTGANTSLSNLTTTSINQTLLPGATLTYDIGSNSLRWANGFIRFYKDSSGAIVMADDRTLRDSTGNTRLDWGTSGQISLSATLLANRGMIIGSKVGTTATVGVAAADDHYIGINYAGAVAVNLPAGAAGQHFIIKDESGLASTNNITVNRNGSDTFQTGATTDVINTNYGSRTYVFRGGKWWRAENILPLWNKENLTLSAGDITNQYKDLSFQINSNSLFLSVSGVVFYEGTDYTLSVVSGVTRVTFAGDLATGGAAALIAGDILRVQYTY